MIRRITQLFHRYANHHGEMHTKGFPLRDLHGKMFGMIDTLSVRNGRLKVEGWSFYAPVGVICNGQHDEAAPSLVRTDVTASYDNGEECPTPGFALDVRYEMAHTVFWTYQNGERLTFPLDSFGGSDFRRMRRKQVLPFMGALVRALPSVFRWYTTRDLAARARVKDIFGLREHVASDLINDQLFTDPEIPLPAPQTEITIVIPVYNAFDLLPDVLARVLENTDLPYHLIIVEDKSSDAAVRPYLRDWHAALPADIAPRIELLENAENLGFIRSVNRAFDRALELGHHVVLLNSDAFVPAGWASRLLAPIYAHDKVATVTPMSNDAEIFNVPVICERSALEDGVADLIDAAAARLSTDTIFAEAPTGVGFCMAMNIDYLKLEPQLDTIFGKGYGEEVDWCRRVKARGGRHLGHAGLFVEHRGGTSFGSEEKLKLVMANNQIIAKRYTGYDQMVQDFIRHDPLSSPRLALSLAWADAQAVRQDTGPVPVYLAHDMGGGAEHYLKDRITSELESRAAAVVLRVGGPHRWQIEVHSAGGVVAGDTEDDDLLRDLMDLLSARHVIYSCAVGDRDPAALPTLLHALAQGPEHRLEILMHDFFPLSPSYTLLDEDGVYRGVPAADSTDRAHQSRTPEGMPVSLQDWRAAWGTAMAAADHVTVFSQNSADLVLHAYPQVKDTLRIIRHALLHDIPVVPSGGGKNGKPVIGVLGNIGLQKGAKVLQDLSRHLAKTGEAHLVVVGNFDPAYALASPAKVHGSYALDDVPALVEKYGITDWLMPSIWPETFSYAIHEVIATGLPVWSFDLGAQGDAARRAAAANGQGGVLDLGLHTDDFALMLDTMFEDAKGVTA